MKEVKALPEIMPRNYEVFGSYKMCIVNNHTRLSAVGLEHEVSNVDTIQQLVSKLPWAQVEKGSQFLEEQEEEAKIRPLKVFLKWL